MLSNKDRAIAHGITRPKIIATFHKNTQVQDDGCIVWTKADNYSGYGIMGISLEGRTVAVLAHRFAWALKHGMESLPIGGRLKGERTVLNHLCYTPMCVNPNHLEVILQSLNNSPEKRKPRKPNDAIIADNLEDFMEQIRNTER